MCRIILSHTQDLIPFPEKAKESAVTFNPEGLTLSMRSSSSQRSKYVSNSKLTKSNLFSALKGRKLAFERDNMMEMNLQVELLSDAFDLTNSTKESITIQLKKELKNYREDCRKVLRALEHY